jgi:hypothetical protein
MTYSHFSLDFADVLRPILSLWSNSEAAYSVKSILCAGAAGFSPSRARPSSSASGCKRRGRPPRRGSTRPPSSSGPRIGRAPATLSDLAPGGRAQRPGGPPRDGAPRARRLRCGGAAARGVSARLDFGFIAIAYIYGIFARAALKTPLRWEGGANAFVYRLQKRDDLSPPAASAFPRTSIGPVVGYRVIDPGRGDRVRKTNSGASGTNAASV